MRNTIALTNVSFDFLASSSEFLNEILNNISSCVLLLDKDMKLVAYNDPITTIFSARSGENLKYIRCGEAIGCAYQVDEMKQCGETSKCCDCELRISSLSSYINDVVYYKKDIIRPFYNKDGVKEEKNLQFSTRLFRFKRDKYVLLIVDDVTRFIEKADH